MTEQWERIRGQRNPYIHGESRQAFHGFEHYRDLGSARSLVAAYNDHLIRCRGRQCGAKRAPGSWSEWSINWRWVERAEAWDRHLDSVRRAEMEAAERAEVEKWASIRREIREKEVALGRALIAKAEEMLKHPITVERRITEQTVAADGHTIVQYITIVEPARWNFSTIGKYAEFASKLIRLAAEMETDRTKIDVAMVKAEARKLAEEFGIPEEDILAQAEQIAREYVSQTGGAL